MLIIYESLSMFIVYVFCLVLCYNNIIGTRVKMPHDMQVEHMEGDVLYLSLFYSTELCSFKIK